MQLPARAAPGHSTGTDRQALWPRGGPRESAARATSTCHRPVPTRPPDPSTPRPPPRRAPVAALSQTLSTAALDKHPQSRARGITLDLGFSAFTAPLPDHLAHLPYDQLQITLVDCPGHASLIRTVVGGECARRGHPLAQAPRGGGAAAACQPARAAVGSRMRAAPPAAQPQAA